MDVGDNLGLCIVLLIVLSFVAVILLNIPANNEPITMCEIEINMSADANTLNYPLFNKLEVYNIYMKYPCAVGIPTIPMFS